MMTLSIKIKLLTYVVLVLTTFVNIVTDQYLRISLTLYDSMKLVLDMDVLQNIVFAHFNEMFNFYAPFNIPMKQ